MVEKNDVERSISIAFYEKLLERMSDAREEAFTVAQRMGVQESMAHLLVDNVAQSCKTAVKKEVTGA